MARKEKRYNYLYKTTNILTGRYYYGMHSTDNLDDGYLGSGKRLRYSVNKYGEENHQIEIIEYCQDRNSLMNKEKELVTLNEIAKKDCMNLMVGGKGGFVSLEATKKGYNALKIKYGDKYNDKRSEWSRMGGTARIKKHGSPLSETKNRCDWNGKKHKPETKLKISKSNIGNGVGVNNSQFGTCWITNGLENKKMKKNDVLSIDWIFGRTIKMRE